MSGIIEQQGHKLYVINGMPDHVHSIISMSPKQAPSDLLYHVKRSSSLWINENRFVAGKFSWQEGFGGFSLGRAQLTDKISYINQQKEHHKVSTFHEEYQLFLKENDIVFEEKYLFKPI
jgi:REP element-mobilizing transposase RayT